MSELAKMNLTEFSELLASDAPAPGGGSVAALSGALGVALTSMVSALTLGKEKYAEYQDLAKDTLPKAAALRNDFLAAIERDTEAFNGFSAALALPKGSDEEKAARIASMQEALTECIESPLYTMELSEQALLLTDASVGKSNKSAASDLAVSALMLEAAAKSAYLNVLINLGSLKDKELADKYSARAEKLLENSVTIAQKIYETIKASL